MNNPEWITKDGCKLEVGTRLLVRSAGAMAGSREQIVQITKVLKTGYRLENGRFLRRDGTIPISGFSNSWVVKIATEDDVVKLAIAESRRYTIQRLFDWSHRQDHTTDGEVIASIADVIARSGWFTDEQREVMAPFMRSAGFWNEAGGSNAASDI